MLKLLRKRSNQKKMVEKIKTFFLTIYVKLVYYIYGNYEHMTRLVLGLFY